MLTTAAGTIAPAKVLVIGAASLGCKHRDRAALGAVVTAYDTRTVVAEQVKSLGAKFSRSTSRERRGSRRIRQGAPPEAIAKQRADGPSDRCDDVVITTAAIPGKRAPILVTSEAWAMHRAA